MTTKKRKTPAKAKKGGKVNKATSHKAAQSTIGIPARSRYCSHSVLIRNTYTSAIFTGNEKLMPGECCEVSSEIADELIAKGLAEFMDKNMVDQAMQEAGNADS